MATTGANRGADGGRDGPRFDRLEDVFERAIQGLQAAAVAYFDRMPTAIGAAVERLIPPAQSGARAPGPFPPAPTPGKAGSLANPVPAAIAAAVAATRQAGRPPAWSMPQAMPPVPPASPSPWPAGMQPTPPPPPPRMYPGTNTPVVNAGPGVGQAVGNVAGGVGNAARHAGQAIGNAASGIPVVGPIVQGVVKGVDSAFQVLGDLAKVADGIADTVRALSQFADRIAESNKRLAPFNAAIFGASTRLAMGDFSRMAAMGIQTQETAVALLKATNDARNAWHGVDVLRTNVENEAAGAIQGVKAEVGKGLSRWAQALEAGRKMLDPDGKLGPNVGAAAGNWLMKPLNFVADQLGLDEAKAPPPMVNFWAEYAHRMANAGPLMAPVRVAVNQP